MNASPAYPSRTLRAAAWWARAVLWLVLGAWCVFGLSWGVLHGWIVPRIGEWRPQLEAVATRALGVKVTVGEIRAESTGAIPAFELRDVRLYDAQGREALHLPRVLSALSVPSLWRGGFEQLLIDAPILDVRRTREGRIQVAGIDVSTRQDADQGALADWFFSQTEFVIRQGTLRWSDDLRPEAPPLALQALDLIVRNPGRQHLIRLDATPPPEWGRRFSLRAQMRSALWQAGPGRWRDWTGTLYGEFANTDLKQLRRHMDLAGWVGIDVDEGRGALRLWADVNRGAVTAVTTDLALQAVAVRLGRALEPLALDHLSGRFDMERRLSSADLIGQDLSLSTRDLHFRTRDGQVWPGGNVRYEQHIGASGEVESLNLQADRLDLQALGQLARRLPLEAAVHGWLERLRPTGLVDNVALRWARAPTATAPDWRARGKVSGLSLAAGPAAADSPRPGRPGLSGVSADFDIRPEGGQARIELNDGHLEFPGVFAEPRVPLQRLQTDLQWKVQGEQIEVQVPQLRFANADMQGELRGSWRTSDPSAHPEGDRFPGELDLHASLERADGSRVHRYLPLEIAAPARTYVRDAVQRGQARDVRFRVKGDLWHFPFDTPGTGEFNVQARLSGIDLAYVPRSLQDAGDLPWPTLTDLEATLTIDRATLRIGGAAGGVREAPGLRLSQAEARIDHLTDQPRLDVRARVSGPATQALAIVNGSPLRGHTGEALVDGRIDGRTEVQFSLDLPIEKPEATRVQGQVRFEGNNLQITPETPRLERTTGTLDFSDEGFRISRAVARLLGGEVRFDGGMRRVAGQPVIQFEGQGQASAEGLRSAREWDGLARLGQVSSGQTSYQARLAFRGSQTEMLVTSDLQGLAIDLPAPLGKAGPAALPLRYELAPQTTRPGAAARDRLTLALGPATAPLGGAVYEREHGASAPQVLRGALTLGTGAWPTLPTQGVQAHLVLDDIDLNTWDRLLAAQTPQAPAPAGATAPGMAYWPTTYALRATRLVHDGRSFHDIVAGGSRQGDIWRANVDARELNGYLEYRPSSAAAPGRVYARLARLTLPSSTANQIETLLQEQPTQIPALDIVVDDFQLSGRPLGRLEIEAINRGATVAAREGLREWRLTRLNLQVPEARLEASGNWAVLGAQAAGATPAAAGAQPRRTALSFKLDIQESGALLSRFGMKDTLRGGKGRLEGSIGWLGSPLAIHYPSLGGQLRLDMARGQFLKAEPGIAKLLGVLSLQSLPRRLALDFRDVFSEGFAFDFVRGDARIDQGVISTNNLQMKGVNAAVLIEGSADIARETQDITAVVIPDLNTGTASLIATIINPATGIAGLLAQFLLRQPMQEAATQQFHITGPWSDPKVEKVDRRTTPNDNASEGGQP